MFWLLVLLASATFAPCVIVPVLREYRAVKLLEKVETGAIERMRTDVGRQRAHLDALRKDPLVVARVAQRDLAYTRRNETTVFVGVGSPVEKVSAPAVLGKVELPTVVATVLGWLPFSDRSDIYADPATRGTLMALSGALLVAAFLLYPPRRRLGA